MAVTNELIYEVLKQIQDRMGRVESGIAEVRTEMNAMRVHMIGMQTGISNICARLASMDNSFERIEKRLDIADAPAL